MKVLFFNIVIDSLDNGGQIGIQRNLDMCIRVFGAENVVVFRMYQPSRWRLLYNMMTLDGYYSSSRNNREFKRLCESYHFDMAFVNGALTFNYLKALRQHECLINTYFHNIDYYYYLGKYQFSKKIIDKIVAIYIYYCERKTVSYSQITIALNQRDADGVKRLYGCEIDLILPIGMEDEGEMKGDIRDIGFRPYCLFVGSNFYANIEGVDWFVRNVAPYINMDFWIVGSCCSSFVQDEMPPNVFMKGRVDDLHNIYINSSCVVSPIFSGSGMKTKTIEALKFGKSVFGTSEAFEGIIVDYSAVGALCNDAQEYIESLNSLGVNNRFNEYSYRAFRNLYSYEAVFNKYNLFIKKCVTNDCKK